MLNVLVPYFSPNIESKFLWMLFSMQSFPFAIIPLYQLKVISLSFFWKSLLSWCFFPDYSQNQISLKLLKEYETDIPILQKPDVKKKKIYTKALHQEKIHLYKSLITSRAHKKCIFAQYCNISAEKDKLFQSTLL